MEPLITLVGCQLTVEQLQNIFRDVFECKSFQIFEVTPILTAKGHYWLFKRAGILHRDISIGNVMYRMKGGMVHGVLNDFDHACKVDDPGPTLNRRTGTVPYMAIDILLQDSSPTFRHLYRYDLESLYYVMIAVVCPDDPFVQVWNSEETMTSLGQAKGFQIHQPAPKPAPDFDSFHNWFRGIRGVLSEGIRLQTLAKENGQAFDNTTLARKVTYETFRQVLWGDSTLHEPATNNSM
ncbi:hypothetical protein BKA62DRAFT_625532 [Auriculariales sp. MPI-PUGE-AT-0066]|nr:hypothetical protein BKA62DRAFT_625532 [Auriculariales sp. MPI-PUGE-AT-0066]